MKALPKAPRPSRLAPKRTAKQTTATRRTPGPTALATIVALGSNGEPWIELGNGRSRRRSAATIAALGPSAVGREALVCFSGRSRKPVILGLIRKPGDEPPGETTLDLTVNRRRVVVAADEELSFRCGKASITLTANGKVVIQGADLVSSAQRINRIRGGAVRIN
jgi:Domain of unknown function (DUF6484)